MITKPKKLLAGSVAAVTAAALLTGVGPAGLPAAQAATGSVKVLRTLVKGQNVPWGLAKLSDNKIVYTERDTHLIRWVNVRTGTFHTIGKIKPARSDPSAGGEGGLLGIAVDPQFSKTHVLYVYYSTAKDNRVARVHYYPNRAPYHQLGRPHVIKAGIPHGLHHNGGQLRFSPGGMLYVTTGDAENTSLPQKKTSLGGKILRITRYGKPAPNNPFKGSSVWSYGHRNVQGLSWDPSGRLWASEFGDRKADELNLIKKGHNYGWPATQGKTSHKGYTSPVAQWGTEVDSPSGIAYTNNTIWMAALKGERLWRIPMHGAKAGTPKAFLVGKYGRIRGVLRLSPGKLLITTSNTDGRATPGRSDDRIIEVSVR
ncbi:oxidoreductase [Microlunatus endophyticus]|uniref:Oxidoreductase n=1 Tax=Microlunatus endophyticus TaxID=1716077 RepID=A0A917S4H0_9ACTN|nr:PQQ-dependent sugar dehydrogenase [Microlunatus endophyticus]GGL57415.1 oxidoreductase [Microlunatus endophyticus]